jgi:DNA polymerase III alpha subunit
MHPTAMIHSKTALYNMPMTNLKENDLVELLYQGKAGALTVASELLADYNIGCRALGQDPVFTIKTIPDSVEDAITEWNIPAAIADLNLDVYFAEKVKTLDEAMRVAEELALYRERKMEPMLRFMIHLVNVMRENEIVWGVGRGSSVSSFLLYLAGLHSINSVKYNLDIKEFIR